MTTFILTPAYGRDYKSAASIVNDFREGKDFIMQPSGSYANRADIDRLHRGERIEIKFRYNRLTRIHVLKYTAIKRERHESFWADFTKDNDPD